MISFVFSYGVCVLVTENPSQSTQNSGIYDLHCHSDQSDGILSPEALVSRAKANNVEVLALTDHDTVAGVRRAQKQGDIEGIKVLPGIEFSSLWKKQGVHIVGLNVDMDAKILEEAVQRQESSRDERARRIGEKLGQMGIEDAYEGARRCAGEGVIGRPHFAAHLVENGYAKNTKQAFKKYLGSGKPGDIKQMWPQMEEVVEWILLAGGTPVLAHPAKYDITRTKLRTMVENFVASGGKAIEVVSGYQALSLTKELASIAQKYDLKASCGSDFHGPFGEWQELGRFPQLPDSIDPVWSIW